MKTMAKEVYREKPDARTTSIFGGPANWMYVTLEDESGLVSITSDYGAWSYFWPARSRGDGVSLRQFLRQCSGDYLVGKFTLGREVNVFDPEATLKSLRRQVLEARRARRINRQSAHGLWRNLDDDIYEDCTTAESFLDKMPGGIVRNYRAVATEVWGESPWEDFQYRPSAETVALREHVLPALRRALDKGAI